MNVNAANEDMLSESELKKLPPGGEGERRRGGMEDGGRWMESRKLNTENSCGALEVLLCNRFIFIIMTGLH